MNIYLSNLGGNAEVSLSWEKEQVICFESAAIGWEVWGKTGGQLVERLGSREQRLEWWLLQASWYVTLGCGGDDGGIENRRPGARHRCWWNCNGT